jgi:AAA15 family ATPase/GTPase
LRRQESLGTQKFFAIAGALLMAIRNNNILWIDELDSKFHPLLFETIIKFFNSNRFNHKGAQLIFTTHSTQLLKEKILRRDQIYTVDKDNLGISTIKGMHNANVRIDSSYEKLYLEGKFGSVKKINLDDEQLSLF